MKMDIILVLQQRCVGRGRNGERRRRRSQDLHHYCPFV